MNDYSTDYQTENPEEQTGRKVSKISICACELSHNNKHKSAQILTYKKCRTFKE